MRLIDVSRLRPRTRSPNDLQTHLSVTFSSLQVCRTSPLLIIANVALQGTHGQTSTSASHHGAEEPTGKVHVWLAAAEYSALASQLRFRQQHTQPPEPALHWRDVRQDIKHLVHARPVLRDAGVYGEPGGQWQAVDAAVAVRHLPALRQPAFHAVWNPRTGHL